MNMDTRMQAKRLFARQKLMIFLVMALISSFLVFPDDVRASTSTVSNITSLREALENGNGTVIMIQPGIYSLDEPILIRRDVTLIGAGGNENGEVAQTVIAGTGDGRLFDINPDLDDTGYHVTFKAMTLKNGRVPDTAEYGGGAIAADVGASGSLTLFNMLIEGNTVGTGNGDPINNDLALAGGGVYVSGLAGGSFSMEQSRVQNNRAVMGGGIFVSGDIDVSIVTSTIDSNVATQVQGGGLALLPASPMAGDIQISQSTISNNRVEGEARGGGIYLNAPARIDNTTISGNEAGSGYGGGLFIEYFSDVLIPVKPFTVINAAITNNTAQNGGAIHIQAGTPTVHNTILAGNHGGHLTQNLSTDSNSGSGLHPDSSHNLIDVDPGLAPLADNGGPTWTHALVNGSAAIDAGDNQFAKSVDQRGRKRIIGHESDAKIDIGAYEANPTITKLIDQRMFNDESLTIPFSVGYDPANADSLKITVNLDEQTLNPLSQHPEQNLLSDDRLQMSGTGSARNLTITPYPGQSGTAKLRLQVEAIVEGKLEQMTTTFMLEVIPAPDLKTSRLSSTPLVKGKPAELIYIVTNEGIGPTFQDQAVNITFDLPAGINLQSISGDTWICDQQTHSCFSQASIAPGKSSEPIVLHIDVQETAAESVEFKVKSLHELDQDHVFEHELSEEEEVFTLATVQFTPNGLEVWSKQASSTVTVIEKGTQVEMDALYYAWSQETDRTLIPDEAWVLFDQGETFTAESLSGDWYLHIMFTDRITRIAPELYGSIRSERFRVDNQQPSIDVALTGTIGGRAYLPDTWTNESVELTIVADDLLSGLQRVEYSLDGGKDWTTYSSSVILQEGEYDLEVKAIDKAGNLATWTASGRILIDQAKPALAVSTLLEDGQPYSSGTWTSQKVTLSIAASDSLSGLEEVRYSLDGGNTWSPTSDDAQITLQDGVHAIKVEAKDKAGNVQQWTGEVKIEQNKPSLTVLLSTADGENYSKGTWTKQDVTLEIDAAAISGLAAIQYSLNGGAPISYVQPVELTTGSHQVEVLVTSNIGLTSTWTGEVNIDPNPPVLNVTLTTADGQAYTLGTWTNQSVTLDVAASDALSQIATVEYSLDDGQTWLSYTQPVDLSDGIHPLQVRAVDQAGNAASYSGEIKIAKQAPSLDVVLTTADGQLYSPVNWTNQTVTLEAAATQAIGGIQEILYSLNGDPWSAYVAPLYVTDEGLNQVEVRAVGHAGNETKWSGEIKIDQTMPNLAVTLTKADGQAYTSGTWTNQSVTLDVTASDALSQIKETEYSFDGGLNWNAFLSPVSLGEGDYLLSVRTTDHAGNQAQWSERVRINQTNPNFIVSRTTSSGQLYQSGSWTNQSVTLSVYAANAGSGLDSLLLSQNGGSWMPFDNGSEWTLTQEGEYALWFKATDHAGNSEILKENVNISYTSPVIQLTQLPLNETYTAMNVTVTASVYGSTNGLNEMKWAEGDRTKEYFSSRGTQIPGGTNQFTVKENGTYSVYVRDFAGNVAVQTMTVSDIKKEEPPKPIEPEPVAPTVPTIPEPAETDQEIKVILSNGQVITAELVQLISHPGMYQIKLPLGETDVVVSMPVRFVSKLMASEADGWIQILNDKLSYTFPLQEIFQALEANHILDGRLIVEIHSLTGDEADEIKKTLTRQGLQAIFNPIHFKLFIIDDHEQTYELDTFQAYVTRSLMVEQEVHPDQTVVVWFDPASQEWRPVPTQVRSSGQGSEITFKRQGNSVYAVVQSDVTFADIQNHWARKEIEVLASKLIVKGTSQDTFAPEKSFTRAEFIALLVRALAISTSDQPIAYSDIFPTSWYASAVRDAHHAGLIHGYGDGTFRPDQTITREEIAVILQRAAHYTGYAFQGSAQLESPAYFNDSHEIAQWARKAASELGELQIFRGDQQANFLPKQNATRAEAVALLKRLLVVIDFMN